MCVILTEKSFQDLKKQYESFAAHCFDIPGVFSSVGLSPIAEKYFPL
jgi:hypothetical protein